MLAMRRMEKKLFLNKKQIILSSPSGKCTVYSNCGNILNPDPTEYLLWNLFYIHNEFFSPTSMSKQFDSDPTDISKHVSKQVVIESAGKWNHNFWLSKSFINYSLILFFWSVSNQITDKSFKSTWSNHIQWNKILHWYLLVIWDTESMLGSWHKSDPSNMDDTAGLSFLQHRFYHLEEQVSFCRTALRTPVPGFATLQFNHILHCHTGCGFEFRVTFLLEWLLFVRTCGAPEP